MREEPEEINKAGERNRKSRKKISPKGAESRSKYAE